MAASDKPFHNQRTLDIVYAVSNILMLLSVVWMLVDDYRREYKVEQRAFREVEVAMAMSTALQSLPTESEFVAAEKLVTDLKALRDSKKDELASARASLVSLRPAKEKAEAAYQAIKAEVDSKSSFRDIALEHASKEEREGVTKEFDTLLKSLNEKLAVAQANRDEIALQMKAEQIKIDDIEGKLTKAVAEFKKVNDRLDTQVKLAINKRWGWGDWFRTLPVINGFADPLRIHQFTIDDVPIDYNFKKVTRFDRCMSCHLGIDRPGYTGENLMKLTEEDANTAKLEDAIKLYDRRVAVLDDKDKLTIPNPRDLRLSTLSKSLLTPARINEFCAHPRLDLFVGSNSKHPAEKFGCTSCHSGQGSGTSFTDSSHSPNSLDAAHAWTKERGYEFNHMWDFPMHSKRFVEASCLKCHHEVTDLISSDNRNEAPKLLRGHTLIKENGCFGCHEISGWKGGQRVGPDLRLEPSTPLEDMNPIERDRVVKDTDNRPGTMRKVGPSLARVSEKVSQDWMEKWLRAPSAFRPDTKMPHYYGLSTNSKEFLAKEAPDQQKFPDTEMASIAHFLTATSKNYVAEAKKYQNDDAATRAKDEARLIELLNKGRLEENDKVKEQTELARIKLRIRLRKEMDALKTLEREAGKVLAQKYQPDDTKSVDRGHLLFVEKGCLACHTHQGTEAGKPGIPEISSDAVFGPNLSQVAQKVGATDAGRKWLIQWILNPHIHSPRSRMPVTHLKPDEAADIADWLLAQPYQRDANDPWLTNKIEQPTKKDLQDLARVYLVRMLSKSDLDRYLDGKFKDGADWNVVKGDLTKDEHDLRDKVQNEDDLKYYLGKKAVTRLGCFGCHDIPGFESVKSIGVGLNDWGKKPADRLAFDDIKNFYQAHYYTKDSLVDDKGKPYGLDKDGKEPYESFFADALIGHHPKREGFLNQKIRDPRSYDFNRIRTWDDRSRMPKFTLGRPRKKADEKEEDFKGRTFKDEAEAREAVATFVLGLTAEQVPIKSINTPAGDRLAEVKGRQILDKYNCNGCHLIRPGVYDFKPGEKSLKELLEAHDFEEKAMIKGGEIKYPNHINWVGRNPIEDKLRIYISRPQYEDGVVGVTLNEALRFGDKDKKILNIPAGSTLNLQVADFDAAAAGLKSQEAYDRHFLPNAQYGGAFANLLSPWLVKKDKARFPADADARGALPPSLVGQGERTQPDWLYNFLLDPFQVRRLSVLRMPKFNMSKEEAKILVDYFAAVTRQTNPGIGLPYPHQVIAGREPISGEYWRKKTADYVKHLKATKQFEARVKAYEPVWERVKNETEATLKVKLDENKVNTDKSKKEMKALEEKLEGFKDPKDKKKAELDLALAIVKGEIGRLDLEKKQLEKDRENLDVKNQRAKWESEEAYVADGYRMLTSRELCTKCHQVGNTLAASSDPTAKQGPPLDVVFDRLRPDWIERWVDKPQRFVPYQSLMIAYFNKDDPKYQNLHAGPAHEQIRALRDVLLNYQQISRLPINAVHNPDRK